MPKIVLNRYGKRTFIMGAVLVLNNEQLEQSKDINYYLFNITALISLINIMLFTLLFFKEDLIDKKSDKKNTISYHKNINITYI